MPAKKKTSKTSKTLDEESTKLMENIESANKKLEEQEQNEPIKEESSIDQEKRIKKQAQLKKQKQKQKEMKENEQKEMKENEQNNQESRKEMSQQEMQNRRIEMERMRQEKIRNSEETLNVSVPFLLNIRDLLISITPRTNWQSNELLNAGMILEHLNRINSLFMGDNLPGAPESTGTS